MSRQRHPAARSVMAALFMTLVSLPVGAADTVSPVGRWQTATGESRYEVSFCGDSQICARLTWLRSDARTPENLAYLNDYVVKGARQTGANSWSGTVTYGGEKIGGKVVLVDADSMRLSSCMLMMCQTVEFERI